MRLNIEALENRLTPSITLVDGVLTVAGSAQADSIIVTQVGTQMFAMTGVAGSGAAEFAAFDAAAVNSVVVHAGDGNDNVYVQTGKFAQVHGEGGDDCLIVFGWRENVIDGGAGADVLVGDGNDLIASDLDDLFVIGGQGVE